jgi:hypothetical protein
MTEQHDADPWRERRASGGSPEPEAASHFRFEASASRSIVRSVRHRSAALLGVGAACFFGSIQEVNAGELDGKWALLEVTMTVAEVPMMGPVKATRTTISVHDVTSDAASMKSKATLCSITVLGEKDLLKTTIGPKLFKAIPPPSLDAKLAKVNGKLTFFQAGPPVILGAKLASPDEALPADAKDKRLFDQDTDFKPGITLTIKGMAEGDIHLSQRSWSRLDGSQQADGTFGGIVRHGLTQAVVGATVPMLAQPPPNVPVVAGSYFRLGRLPKGGCPEAAELAKSWTK